MTMFSLLLADAPRGDFRILWTTLPIVGIILLGAAIIALARRWRERPRSFRLTASEQLAHFRSLYEKGELAEEEFTRIQTLLGERIKQELEMAPPPVVALETEEPKQPPSANGTHAPPAV